MSEQQQVNLETMSLEDIRRMAHEEAQNQVAELEQPRDENGRFKAEAEQPVLPVQPQEYTAEAVIDLGDGSGEQRFAGKGATELDAHKDLTNKLRTAQMNATRKIREQADELRSFKQKKQEEDSRIDADKEFVYSQELMSRPTEAMKKMFKDMTGYDITEFRTVAERAKAFETAETQRKAQEQQNTAAQAFMSAHPEYLPNQRNGQKLVKAINLLMQDATPDEKVDYQTLLEKAYEDLTESGLLELRATSDVTADETESTGAGKARIEQPEEVVPTQRSPKKASSLMNRGRAVTAPKSTEPSEDDLYNMPLDKLRELAQKA